MAFYANEKRFGWFRLAVQAFVVQAWVVPMVLTWIRATTLRRASAQTLAVLGLVWLVIRFVGLELSPPGFWMDETFPAAHAMCLAQTGHNVDGVAWPLYSRACGGGHHPLTLLGFDVFWIQLFGTSRAAFRAVSAFFITVTCLGLFSIARDLAALVPATGHAAADSSKRAFPWLVLMAALVSPWSFQFSRVAWEGPLAPAFMVLSLMCLLRMRRSGKRGYVWAVFCGVFAVLSMSTYPPLRAVVPFVLTLAGGLLLLAIGHTRVRWWYLRRLSVAAGVAAAGLLPTLLMLLDGEINGRMNDVLITGATWVKEHRGLMDSDTFVIKTFLDNVAAHLRPSYLFIHGDVNPRHSSQLVGQLSPVDAFALLLAVVAVIASQVRLLLKESATLQLASQTRWFGGIATAAVACGFFGVVPSALTWDGVPHALRSIGSWPFVALFTGAVLAVAWGLRVWLPPMVALVAAAYSAYFLPGYFSAFDRQDSFTYMRDFSDEIWNGKHRLPRKAVTQILSEKIDAGNEVVVYYLMHEGRMSCEQALATYERLRSGPKP